MEDADKIHTIPIDTLIPSLPKDHKPLSPEIGQSVEQESDMVVDSVIEQLSEVTNSSGMLFVPREDNSLIENLKRKGKAFDKKIDEMGRKFMLKNRLMAANAFPVALATTKNVIQLKNPGFLYGTDDPLPIVTTGVSGFVFQHIGNIDDTIILYHLFSTGLDVGSAVLKKIIKKELTEDQKFAISLIVSGLGMQAIEMKIGVPDPLDTFGIAVGLIYMAAAYRVIQSSPSDSKSKANIENITEPAEQIVDSILQEKSFASEKTD
mgnify:CR=1 FL=1